MGEKLRDKILSTDDSYYEDHYVDRWDVTVRVSTITGKQRSILYQKAQDKKGELDWPTFQGLLLAQCLREPETNERVFEDGDADKLMDKNSVAIGPLINVAMRVNGLTKEDFGDAEKN